MIEYPGFDLDIQRYCDVEPQSYTSPGTTTILSHLHYLLPESHKRMQLVKSVTGIIYNKIVNEWFVRLQNNYYSNYLEIQKRVHDETNLTIDALYTDNRRDIDYRVDFLKAVLDDGRNFGETEYYYFISDPERWTNEPAQEHCKYFIELADDIKKNGIKTPITALRIEGNNYQAKVEFDGEKKWNTLKDRTGYQLMEGAHRLAIAAYLGYDTIPVYVLNNPKFEIPDYTAYINKREEYYQSQAK